MSLNIKNEDAHRLARQLSELTGESMAQAVTQAIRERLERVRKIHGLSLADRLLIIGKDSAVHLKAPFTSIDHGNWLYDKNGLPK